MRRKAGRERKSFPLKEKKRKCEGEELARMGDDERHKSDNRRGEERKLKLPFTSAVQFSVDSVIFHKVGFRQIVIYQ